MARLIYARGRAEKVSLKETYAYKLVISRNNATQQGPPPEGVLEITVPYDGRHYFTRAACADVEHQLDNTNPLEDVDVQVGHLLLTNYDRTDLKSVFNLGEQYDALPIRVPAMSDEIFTPDHLYDDQRAALISHSYQPRAPEVIPIGVTMTIADETSFRAQKVGMEDISQYVSEPFQLFVDLQIKLDLPKPQPPQPAPVIKPRIVRAGFDWPTLTSFSTLELTINGERHPLHYNPAKTRIEWDNIGLDEHTEAQSKTRVFCSPLMRLQIKHPGELYQQPRLTGAIEIEIEDLLLSGVDLRVFDGAGGLIRDFKPKLTTRILVDVEMLLADAFAQRVASPYQLMVFDEVIPDPMRLVDILITLGDQGFHVEKPVISHTANTLRSDIIAKRSEGPHTMWLWLFVDGRQFPTERQTELPGGQIYTSVFNSGDLKIHMLGELPGNVYELTRRMNAIQASLCERFARLRAKR